MHQGNWHGDIAIKFLNMESTEDEAPLEAFRKEVATFRKTRHENLILFMGACMNPPKLAIVTSLCKGEKLALKLGKCYTWENIPTLPDIYTVLTTFILIIFKLHSNFF